MKSGKYVQKIWMYACLKPFVWLLKHTEALSAVACRLVELTGKHPDRIHPKHLIELREPWFYQYIKKDTIVLDIGCNNGQRTLKAARLAKKIYGFDYDQKLLSLAQKEVRRLGINNTFFSYGNAEKKLSFQDCKFDTILLLDVLEHLYSRTQILEEIFRILKSGGFLCLSIPNESTTWKKIQKILGMFYYSDPDHKIEYTRSKIIKLLEKIGFQVHQISPVTLDTPLVGFIDLAGGISLSFYKILSLWRRHKAFLHPEESIGFEIAAQKPG